MHTHRFIQHVHHVQYSTVQYSAVQYVHTVQYSEVCPNEDRVRIEVQYSTVHAYPCTVVASAKRARAKVHRYTRSLASLCVRTLQRVACVSVRASLAFGVGCRLAVAGGNCAELGNPPRCVSWPGVGTSGLIVAVIVVVVLYLK